ncbi:MAG: DUF4097 family beta strand repeat protein, partial [Gemmatimonadetes bacterium]|nr:DUF4097 family beta strand repeat protein [Gemmatimonadota bacterium]
MTSRIALGAALLALAAAPASGQQRVALSGDDVAIYDLAGEVQVRASSGPSVVVEVAPGGDDADKLRVATGRTGAWQTLRVIFPADRIVYDRPGWAGASAELRVREDGTFGDPRIWPEGDAERERSDGQRVRVSGRGSGLHAYADLTVNVPQGKRVALFLGVGRATVENVDGRLRVSTSAGRVSATRTRGVLWAESGSGSLDLAELEGEIRAATGSGGIRLDGARGSRISLETGSGSIQGGRISASQLRAETGSGGIRLDGLAAPVARLETGSGSVEVGFTSDVDEVKVDTGSG